MSNNELINGFSAIYKVGLAYQSLANDVSDPAGFSQAACSLLNNICTCNPSLQNVSFLSNSPSPSGVLLGTIRCPIPDSVSISSTVQQALPNYFHQGFIQADVNLDYAKPFSILLSVDSGAEMASRLAQQILVSAVEVNHSLCFRCADLVMGGNFYTDVYKLIPQFPAKTGGKVYTQQTDFSDLINTLDSVAGKARGQRGSYETVEDYNQSNNTKIDEYLTVAYISPSQYHNSDYDRLRILMESSKKNGMSFILIGSPETLEQFADFADYQIDCSNEDLLIGGEAALPFSLENAAPLTEERLNTVIGLLESAEIIDTTYEAHPSLHTPFFEMNSDEAIRIPFAIDKNNNPIYFEIGGSAPAHALIAGSTGSGKSVALHTLIMQIIHNYHPDDVEIWAIDYKAVEFAPYIENRTPHFRVIAHDTSNEFSLSLIDKLNKEYEDRQSKFLKASEDTGTSITDISDYRRVYGKHSMPRIVVIIDEFQLMTQAVTEYNGTEDYRTKLENLLRLTRAMGISLVLCSQTIASGLSGLSEAARGQIGCRLCLKHEEENEIRETLMLSGPTASEIVAEAKNLRRGQGIYKRVLLANERSKDNLAYEFLYPNILFLKDSVRSEMIAKANEQLGDDFTQKDVIFVRGGGRIAVSEKERHPLQLFMESGYEQEEEEGIEWFPAAPTTLEDYYCLKIENTAAANILLVGEEDNLRESIVVHSVGGFLMNPYTSLKVMIIDENYPDRLRMVGHLQHLHSDRLEMHIGVQSCLEVISKLRKIRPTPGRNEIYIWYGLDKLKNELFLMQQDEEEDEIETTAAPESREDMMKDLMGFLSEINGQSTNQAAKGSETGNLSFDDCKEILKRAFEAGPENNKFHFVIFNNRKAIKNSGLVALDQFENRMGMRMSTDDSYDLFGSSMAVNKANENTVIYYAGSGSVVPLRPYLIPEQSWYDKFNEALRNM